MQRQSVFEKNPKTVTIILTLVLIFMILGIMEVIFRYYINYNIGYYSAISKTADMMTFPYGKIPVNSIGGFDEEFDLQSTKRRVGYFGDSVIFGLGAGYPYRISEILEHEFPSLEHWNLSFGIGTRLYDEIMIRRARNLHLDLAVYVMNLNDISPTVQLADERDIDEKTIGWLRIVERNYISALRDKSYLYNFLRTSVKNLLQRLGYQESGSAAVEFWPSENEALLVDFARRVISLAQRLRSLGTQFCLLIVPYEMQISAEAEGVYSDMGFSWEDGFERGLTQDLLISHLPGIATYDARRSFDRENSKIGEFFVYDKGDKIDWNHPNREGHAKIAKGFVESHECDVLSELGENSRAEPSHPTPRD